MPYALIPDGYSLKKVTKLQKQAVSEKRRHEDITLLIKNPETIAVIAGIVTGAYLTKLLTDLDIPEVTEETKAKIIEKTKQTSFLISPFGLPFLGARKGAQIAGQEEAFDEAVEILKGFLPS